MFHKDYTYTGRTATPAPTQGKGTPTHRADKPVKPDHRRVHHPSKGQLTLEDFLEFDEGGGYGSRK